MLLCISLASQQALGKNEPSSCDTAICPTTSAKHNRLLLAPYAFIPSIEGRSEALEMKTEFEYDAKELASGLNLGGLAYLQWDRGRDFLYFDGLGVRYKDRLSEFRERRLSIEIALLEIGYGRKFCIASKRLDTNCTIGFDPYLGIRHSRFNVSAKINEGGLEGLLISLSDLPDSYQAKERWLDPVAGFISHYQLSQRNRLYLKADAAGLGLGRNDYWNIMGFLNFQLSAHWSVSAGYKATEFDAKSGGENKLNLKLRARGPIAGIIYSY